MPPNREEISEVKLSPDRKLLFDVWGEQSIESAGLTLSPEFAFSRSLVLASEAMPRVFCLAEGPERARNVPGKE
jgi:hypothetical protein